MIRKTMAVISVTVLAMALISGCEQPNNTAKQSWQQFTQRFVDVYFRENLHQPYLKGAEAIGDSDAEESIYNTRLKIGRLTAAHRAAMAFHESELTPEQQFERDYLLAVIHYSLYALTSTRPTGEYSGQASLYPPSGFAVGQLPVDSPLHKIPSPNNQQITRTTP